MKKEKNRESNIKDSKIKTPTHKMIEAAGIFSDRYTM